MSYKIHRNKCYATRLIAIWISFLCFFTPAFFMYKEPVSVIYPLFNYGRILISVVYLILYLRKNAGKINRLFGVIFLFFISYLVSSIFGDLKLLSWVNTSVSIIGLYAMVHYYGKKYIEHFLRYSFLLFFLLLLINDALMVAYPQRLFIVHNELGNQSYHFLSSKNAFSMFSFPLLLFAHLCYERCYIKLPTLCFAVVLAFYPPVVSVSMTSVSCMSLCEIAILLLTNKMERICKAGFWLFLIIVLSILQIVFTYIFELESIQVIVVSFMMKDPTLSGRTLLWNSAHELIHSHLLLGMGNGKDGYYFYTIAPGYDIGSIMWAHNTSLDLLVQGGVFLFGLFYTLIYIAFSTMFNQKQRIDKYSIVVLCIFVSYIVMGFTERFDFRYDLHLVIAIASIISFFRPQNLAQNSIHSIQGRHIQ